MWCARHLVSAAVSSSCPTRRTQLKAGWGRDSAQCSPRCLARVTVSRSSPPRPTRSAQGVGHRRRPAAPRRRDGRRAQGTESQMGRPRGRSQRLSGAALQAQRDAMWRAARDCNRPRGGCRGGEGRGGEGRGGVGRREGAQQRHEGQVPRPQLCKAQQRPPPGSPSGVRTLRGHRCDCEASLSPPSDVRATPAVAEAATLQ